MGQKKKFRVSTTLHLETKYYFSLNLNFKLGSLLGAIRNSSLNLVHSTLGMGKEIHQDTHKLPHNFGEDCRNNVHRTPCSISIYSLLQISKTSFSPFRCAYNSNEFFWELIARHFHRSSDIFKVFQFTQKFQTSVLLDKI